MTRIQETAYPQLKTHYSERELQELFTPTYDEVALMKRTTRDSASKSQLYFIVLLKCYQCIGRSTLIRQVPAQVIDYIRSLLSSIITFSKLDKNNRMFYNKSTRQRHIETIRRHLQINRDHLQRKLCMKKAAMDAAHTKENLSDIINNIIDYLIKDRFELPAYRDLLRLARASRKIMNQHYERQISSVLLPDITSWIDALFNTSPTPEDNMPSISSISKNSTWWHIKQETSSPTTKHIQVFIQYLDWLLACRAKITFDLATIPPARLEQFVSEAMAFDATDMQRLKPTRRYALAVILICFKSATAMDDLCSTLILWIRKFHTQGKEALDLYRKEHANETDHLIGVLHQLSMDVKKSTTDTARLQAINTHLTDQPDAIIEQCEKHLSYTRNNYYSFMLKPYLNKRSILFNVMDQLRIQSTTQDVTLNDALHFIKKHRKTTLIWIDITDKDAEGNTTTLDLTWLSERWFKMVTGKSIGASVDRIHRHYFELAVINEMTDALDAGDVYIDNGYAFDDPNKQLISWKYFYNNVEDYCGLVKLPSRAPNFIMHLQHQFRQTAEHVDTNTKDNPYLSIKNGMPTLKKSPNKTSPSNAKNISKKIAARFPRTNIVDIILDVEKWLNLSLHLKPLSGFEAKIKEPRLRFGATAFSYGCNIGPTEGSRCLQKFSRKQIAWLFNHQATESKLDVLNKKIINGYNQFEMPMCWGNGKSVSVDGTYWDMYKKNLFAAHHIRYGDFGGIGYYHISNKYIALYGNFISCGMHESNYIFDGCVENDSDIQPDIVHGDTGAQTEVTFAFGYLLAIQLMPRIRNFKHLRYYKPSKTDQYKHIDELFCDQVIDWDFIQLHYHDMLRIVMSVRAGKIKPSVLLRRLSSKTRKNKLYYAFRELGRVIRTLFLLNYINDPLMRQTIHAGTCKSEEFNQFISWIRFGDGGVVADNMRFNQQKIVRFGHIVANMVMLHVTANMTKIVNALRKEGEIISDQVLGAFSPYRTDHINRFGIFPIDPERETMVLEYKLVK